MPAKRLCFSGLPTNEDVVGWLADQAEFELVLQVLGSFQAQIGSRFALPSGCGLRVNPVLQTGVGQVLQQLVVEFVVVHEAGKAVSTAVPDVPDEWTMVEKLAVL